MSLQWTKCNIDDKWNELYKDKKEYVKVSKIGEGTYGVVYKVYEKIDKDRFYAMKVFKQPIGKEGVNQAIYREVGVREDDDDDDCNVQLLKELNHENDALLDPEEKQLALVFDYADFDLEHVILTHRNRAKSHIPMPMIRSIMHQMLSGIHYLHSNWIMHRDLKPANILVMGRGEQCGVVKIADFGLARIFQAPLKPLRETVVTLWYRAPELLLGAKHYTRAVDMWAIGCIFAELISLRPLFLGIEEKDDKGVPIELQSSQLRSIFSVLGMPNVNDWPALEYLPHWVSTFSSFSKDSTVSQDNLRSWLALSKDKDQLAALDLLQELLKYDPAKRCTAKQALSHPFFSQSAVPSRKAFGDPQVKRPAPSPSPPVVDDSSWSERKYIPSVMSQQQPMTSSQPQPAPLLPIPRSQQPSRLGTLTTNINVNASASQQRTGGNMNDELNMYKRSKP